MVKNKNSSNLVFAIVFIVAYVVYLMPIFGLKLEFVPGDLGDSRLNNYFLEHAHIWFWGGVEEFWSAPFFFPHSNVIAYSDNHLGSFIFYSFFRFLGFTFYTSYQLWIIFGVLLNYISMILFLRYYKLNVFSICIGALIFTFSAIAIYKLESHSQTVYRFAIPLIWLFHERFIKNNNITDLFWKYFLLAFQFYISIYTGYFMLLFIAAYYLVKIIYINGKWADIRKLLALEGVGLVLFLILIAPLMYPYIQLSIFEGYSNPIGTVYSMLPRFESYFFNPAVFPIFGITWDNLNLEMKHEHFMYLGLFPILIILFFTFNYKKLFSLSSEWLYILVAFWVVALFTINLNGYSIYKLFLLLPGVDSIRAVTRIGLIFLFPAALLSAIFVNYICKNHLRTKLSYLILCGLLVLIVETRVAPYNFKKIEAEQRISKLTEALPSRLPKDAILIYLNPNLSSGKAYLTELDAMILSQSLGVPTLNGYSGRAPHGHVWLESESTVVSYINTIKNQEYKNNIKGRSIIVIQESTPNNFVSYLLNN